MNAAASPVGAVGQVVLYNVIWFSVAIAALLVSVFRPEAAKELVVRTDAVVRRY